MTIIWFIYVPVDGHPKTSATNWAIMLTEKSTNFRNVALLRAVNDSMTKIAKNHIKFSKLHDTN